MLDSQLMEQDQSVLRWGGLSGLLGGIFSIIAMIIVFVLLPPDPVDLTGWVARFPDVMATRVMENVTYLLALILEIPLFLALAWALRKTSLAPALFGSGLGIVGLVAMAASATPHVAHATLSDLYHASGATPGDQATLALLFQAIRGIFDAMLYVGFFIVPLGHILLAIGMLGSPDFGKVIGWTSMVLGIVGLVSAVLQMVAPSSMVGVGSYLAGIPYYLVVGWKVQRLSRTL